MVPVAQIEHFCCRVFGQRYDRPGLQLQPARRLPQQRDIVDFGNDASRS